MTNKSEITTQPTGRKGTNPNQKFTIKITVFWDVTPSYLVHQYCFGGKGHIHMFGSICQTAVCHVPQGSKLHSLPSPGEPDISAEA